MPSRLEFQLDMGRSGAQPPTRRAGGGGMRLLLLGDFGGGAASRPALKDRRVTLQNRLCSLCCDVSQQPLEQRRVIGKSINMQRRHAGAQ